ncbi:hypothetical protein C8R43DRAFT_705813 [Mycena crocata]|nr:hypothetical protein C8R43DRAFT_705813 [Mycena crocata]
MSNSALRAQHSDILSELAKLQTRLEHVQLQLDSIYYPVLTLPPEITAEIFIHSLPDPQRLYNSLNTNVAPMLLMHVCRAWRYIAISTPALWATLGIQVANCVPYFADSFETWLSRAGQRPMTVYIGGPISTVHGFDSLVKAYRRHAGGFQTLRLDIRAEDFSQMYLNVETHMETQYLHFRVLQKLSIEFLKQDVEDWNFDVEDHEPLLMFNNAPLLREVSLIEAPPSYISLPWQNLTKFTGELYTSSQCLEALAKMPSITECGFATFELRDDDLPNAISNPNMQHFSLFQCIDVITGAFANSSEVLEFLTFQGLETLSLCKVHVNDHIFTTFMSRSSPPLQRFTWDPPIGEYMDIPAAILDSMPTLTSLDMRNLDSLAIDTFFNLFARDQNFLPHLQQLFMHCKNDAMYRVFYSAHAPIVKRREVRQGYAQLQSFRASTTHSFTASKGELSPFRKLKAEGMEVYIGTETESYI